LNPNGAQSAAPKSDALLRDGALIGRLYALKAKIAEWATKHDLWDDSGFKTPFLQRGDAPQLGDGLLLISDGALASMFCGGHDEWDRLEEQFRVLLAAQGFWYELHTGGSVMLIPDGEGLQADYLKLYRWQWIQHLAERRLFDLHSEVFGFFGRDPERLKDLHWRRFEEFLDSIFKNQGFHTELGPGSNDGGVDHRLYQSRSIPEIVAVVQAKRYTRQPIKLETVAALVGVAAMERAPRAILATTSRYQPKARKFALNTQSRLDLPTVELACLIHAEPKSGLADIA
jgi:hypothetical protein